MVARLSGSLWGCCLLVNGHTVFCGPSRPMPCRIRRCSQATNATQVYDVMRIEHFGWVRVSSSEVGDCLLSIRGIPRLELCTICVDKHIQG